MSESVAKAPRARIGREKKRGISTIHFRCSGSIRAFATDLDNRRRSGSPGRVTAGPPGGSPRVGRRPQQAPRSAGRARGNAPPRTRSSLNPRARTSSRRARGLSDVLVCGGAFPRAPSDRRGARHGRRPADGAPPPKASRRRRLSKSVAKARIEPEHRKRMVDIPHLCSPPIPVWGAFATDSDTLPPQAASGVPLAPLRARSSRTAVPIPAPEPPFPMRRAQWVGGRAAVSSRRKSTGTGDACRGKWEAGDARGPSGRRRPRPVFYTTV